MSELVRLRGKIYFTKYILCSAVQYCLCEKWARVQWKFSKCTKSPSYNPSRTISNLVAEGRFQWSPAVTFMCFFRPSDGILVDSAWVWRIPWIGRSRQMGCGGGTVGSALSLTIPQTLTLIMHKSKNTEKEKFSHWSCTNPCIAGGESRWRGWWTSAEELRAVATCRQPAAARRRTLRGRDIEILDNCEDEWEGEQWAAAHNWQAPSAKWAEAGIGCLR